MTDGMTTFFVMYINPITTLIVYIVTFYNMFYAFNAIMFSLYLVTNEENKDDQYFLCLVHHINRSVLTVYSTVINSINPI